MNRLDHVLIRVDNLETSVNDFRNAGFKVYFGTNYNDSYNAMIYFQDNTFIELVDTNRFPMILIFLAKTRIINLLGVFYKRIGRYALSTDIFLDYAIYSSDIEKYHEEVKKTQVSKLYHLKRIDSLGRTLKWRLFAFKKMYLPFVISNYSPCKYPETDACNHKNNVQGIFQLNICTKMDLSKLQEEMLNVLNLPPQNIVLEGNVLKITTSNTIVKYIKGKTDKIIGIQLDDLPSNIESLLLGYLGEKLLIN